MSDLRCSGESWRRRATFCAKSALASAWRRGVGGLAGVVQQQREIEDAGVLELLEKFRCSRASFGSVGVDERVEFFDADQGVLVGGVAMEKLVLHEAGELPELRDVAAEKIDLVHRAQDAADLALARADREEGFARGLGILEGAIDEVEAAADELRELRAEPELALLQVLEEPHHAAGSWLKMFGDSA